MGAAILIVEDEPDLCRLIEDRCRTAGYEPSVCTDGSAALPMILSGTWDLIVLDLCLPGRDGFLICQEVRSLGNRVPILMSTARREVSDRVAGLRCGADDYLPKPYEMIELMARIEALLRRTVSQPGPSAAAGSVISFGDCTIDPLRQSLTTPTAGFRPQALEYRLLILLSGNPEKIWSRDELLNLIWGQDVVVSARTVDVHMAGIRKMLKGSRSVRLESRRNQGYVLQIRDVRAGERGGSASR